MMQSLQRLLLLRRRSLERNADVRMAKIWRKESFGDRNATDSRVFELVINELFQLFTDAFGNALMPMRVHDFQDTIPS